MKKSFSLMEVIIAVVILSFAMLTLLQIKSDNIFILSKSNEQNKLIDYINLAVNTSDQNNKNQNIFLEEIYKFKNDDIRREIKDIKVKKRSEQIDSKDYKIDSINFIITTKENSYLINNDIKKKIYTFKIEL
ncbi:MAG: hypothetical protein CL624_13135 [Arcobacter sp.]|nr:hypothetical protein [Arcobacter sp.]|tara:strand:- start:2337 stop:2732 length:396 start_codon:yes stop_codon:yes gene_type:complete